MDWFIADTHFSHDAIRIFADRPFRTVEEMDEAYIERINETVGKKDDLWILGDFAWKRHGHYFGAIRGKKHLILGNHDRMSADVLKNFTSVTQILGREFDAPKGRRYVVMCHYPMVSWNGKCYGSWHLHGHCHGRLHIPGERMVDVGIDVMKRPVNMEFLSGLFNEIEEFRNSPAFKERFSEKEDGAQPADRKEEDLPKLL